MLETICIPEDNTEIQAFMAQGMDREMIRDHLLRRLHALTDRLRFLEAIGDENGFRGPVGHDILETKDGWIYYDELIETDYEICTAKGNGNLKGNNSDYRTKDTSKGQVECAIECSQTKDGILNAILQDAWNNSTPVY